MNFIFGLVSSSLTKPTNEGGIDTMLRKNKFFELYIKNPKRCPVCNNAIPYEKRFRKTCSKECGHILQLNTWESNKDKHIYTSGGYRKGSGNSKHGYYKGFYCDSTYELAFLIYCLDHNIKIERNKEFFIYFYKGKKYKYYPDFIVNNKLIEIKGYHSELVDIKLKSVNKPIDILYNEDLEYVFEYIKNIYHKNKHQIKELYDNNKPQYNYICSYCGKEFKTYNKRNTLNVYCSRKCTGKDMKLKALSSSG